MASWKVEHGHDPEALVIEGLKAVHAAILINNNPPFINYNIGSLYAFVAQYNLDQGTDIQKSDQMAIEFYEKALKLDNNYTASHLNMAYAYYLLARQNAELGIDPATVLERALVSIKMCLIGQSLDQYCRAVQAQVWALQAEWQLRQGTPDLPLLQKAFNEARQVVQQSPDNEDLLRIFAEIGLQMATMQIAHGQRPLALVNEGIAALDRALKLSAGGPRALALRGALALLRAKLETEAGQRLHWLQSAQTAFTSAFQGNALLKRRFGAPAEEVERLVKDRLPQ